MFATFMKLYSGTIFRPGHTLAKACELSEKRLAVAAILTSASFYSAFSFWMYLEGHRPSFTGNPIPAEQYYLWQAVFLPPWLLVAWLASASAAYGIARAFGARATWTSLASSLAFALAVPLAAGYVIPEMIVFGVMGHEALIAAMRFTGPITLSWWGVLTWMATHAATGGSAGRCVIMTMVSLLTFGFIVALLVR